MMSVTLSVAENLLRCAAVVVVACQALLAIALLTCGFVLLDQHLYPVLAHIGTPGVSVVWVRRAKISLR